MPLRDHFHAPLKDQEDWESFHSAWANTIVRRLNSHWLSQRYRSAPQAHLGAGFVPKFEEMVIWRT